MDVDLLHANLEAISATQQPYHIFYTISPSTLLSLLICPQASNTSFHAHNLNQWPQWLFH